MQQKLFLVSIRALVTKKASIKAINMILAQCLYAIVVVMFS